MSLYAVKRGIQAAQDNIDEVLERRPIDIIARAMLEEATRSLLHASEEVYRCVADHVARLAEQEED